MVNGAWDIRPAAIHDARAIAEVHVESYKSVYRGLFPEALLNGLSVEKRPTELGGQTFIEVEYGWQSLSVLSLIAK
jgi:hypothetical protein